MPAEPDHTIPDDTMSAVREILRVATPAAVTMLSYTAMQFVDLLIVARLGADAIAAVGNGGISAFLPAAALFGVVGVISTYVSQNLGNNTPERGSAYAWNGLWLCLACSVFILMPFALVLPHALEAMRTALGLDPVAPRLAEMESTYGRILLAGMFFTVAARSMSNFFYGVHEARVVMVAAILGNLVNFPVTYALTLGAFGAPQLGVAGAAIGTIIGSAFELAILMAAFLSPHHHARYRTRHAWRFSARAIRDIWKIGWPAGLMLGNELACWWVFMAGLIASFGVEHNTAGFIVLRYMHISFMPAVGLSMAVTAVVGKAIGRRRPDLAERRARVGVAICMAYMGACALAMVVFREPLARVFTDLVPVDAAAADLPRIVEITASLLILAAAFQVFDALAITLVGALRGAGDTIWPGLVTAALSWTLIIGLGYALTRLAPALESFGPWIGAASFIIVLAIALSWRWFSGYWKTIDLLHRDRDQPVPTGAEAADPAAIADELHDPAHDTPAAPPAAANRPFGPAGVEPPPPPG